MPMTFTQQLLTIVICILATVLTRFLPFWIFKSNRPTPAYIQYLGQVLPGAIFGMMVIYSLRTVSITSSPYGLPELISLAITLLFHLWRKSMLISLAAGTLSFMIITRLL
ncbi:branched-chain amino acid transporter permease [Streptococcus mitis]|nr:branched-chain amino acid transporter permease [Streptococcus sp. NLN64]